MCSNSYLHFAPDKNGSIEIAMQVSVMQSCQRKANNRSNKDNIIGPKISRKKIHEFR
jgi:hypothetical protein